MSNVDPNAHIQISIYYNIDTGMHIGHHRVTAETAQKLANEYMSYRKGQIAEPVSSVYVSFNEHGVPRPLVIDFRKVLYIN
jgi:hypothetical protein